MNILRRIRGALVIATLWGVAYAAASALLSVASWMFSPTIRRYTTFLSSFDVVPRAGLEAAAGGAVFALIIMFAEGNRTVGSLSERRIWWWGVFAGLASAAAIKLLERLTGGAVEPLKDAAIYCVSFGVIGGAAARFMLQFARGKPSVEPPAMPQ